MLQHPLRTLVAGMVAASLAALTGAAHADKRSFTIAAIEPKGGATVDKEPFPAETVPAGGGYVLNKPDQNNRWEVSTYLWTPSQIVVNEGDEVTLEFVGINGASHPTTINGLGKSFVLKRGTVTRVEFVVDKAGVFKIECGTHRPTMTAEIIVLPRK